LAQRSRKRWWALDALPRRLERLPIWRLRRPTYRLRASNGDEPERHAAEQPLGEDHAADFADGCSASTGAGHGGRQLAELDTEPEQHSFERTMARPIAMRGADEVALEIVVSLTEALRINQGAPLDSRARRRFASA
jgi:hypothetical protein